MNSVAVSRVATNVSKSFGTKEKSNSSVFDFVLGNTIESQKNLQVKELGSRPITKVNNNQVDTDVQANMTVKTENDELKATDQSEIITEYDVDVKKVVKDALSKIAKSLGVSDEELSEMMSVMNLSFMDLFSNDGLNLLLNKVFKTNDEISLLTNADAFEAFKDIKDIIENVLKEVDMDIKTFEQAFVEFQLKEQTAIKQAVPVNQVENVDSEISDQQVHNNKPRVEIEDTRTPQKNAGTETVKEQPIQLENEETSYNKSDEKNIAGKNSSSNDSNNSSNSNNSNSSNNSNFLNHFENVLSHTVSHKFEVVSANGVEELVYYETSAKEILSQITTQIKVAFTDDATTLFLQLQPENLGKVAFSVKTEGGVLTGNFIAESASVKEAIEQNLVNLKASLDQQGIKLDQVKVVVGNTNQFFNKSDQEKAYQQSSKGKRKRYSEQGIESIDTSINIAREALRSTGLEEEQSSIDYTA